MRLLCFLLCVTYASSFYTDLSPAGKEKIVGGSAVNVREVKYQAALEYLGKVICGAAIISDSWLLSAAHCLSDVLDAFNNLQIRTGTSYTNTCGDLYPVTNIIIHEDYPNDRYAADIVLFGASLKFDEYTDSIRMSKSASYPAVGTPMQISGYGRTNEFNKILSSVLKRAQVAVESPDVCQIYYPVSDNVFCATSHHNDYCYGDFGGPGVIDGKLAAIISGNQHCAQRYVPGIYTNVGALYSWILEKTGIPDYE